MAPQQSTATSEASSGAGASDSVTVSVKTPCGSNVSFALASSCTVSHLKNLVAKRDKIAVDQQRIFFGGKELQDAATLDESVVSDGSQLFVSHKSTNVQIMVKTLKDRVFSVPVDHTTTVSELKSKVFQQDPSWEINRQRIIFHGRELSDASLLLTQCGLEGETPCVHVVMRLPAPGAARRSRKDEGGAKAAADGKGGSKRKGGTSPAVTVKSEYLQGDSTSELDEFERSMGSEFLGAYPMAMEMDTAWTELDDDSAPNLPPSPQWEAGIKLPALKPAPIGSVQSMEEAALSPTAAGGSTFADMVANVKTEADEELPLPSTQGRAYDLSKVDDKLRKRLLKNRLSAERSRQRKQAHVESLEFELSCCRSENEHLKKRVASLEAQLASLNITPQQQLAVV